MNGCPGWPGVRSSGPGGAIGRLRGDSPDATPTTPTTRAVPDQAGPGLVATRRPRQLPSWCEGRPMPMTIPQLTPEQRADIAARWDAGEHPGFACQQYGLTPAKLRYFGAGPGRPGDQPPPAPPPKPPR